MTNTDKSDQQAKAGSPKFGRLLLVLFAAVALIVAITLLSEAYYQP